MIFYCFCGFILFVLISIVYWSYKTGISPMPSSIKQKKAIFQLINENIPKTIEGSIFELGSGFLTLALPLAYSFPNNKVIGYEISPIPFYVSKILFYFLIPPHLKLLKKNFFQADLSEASLIICYLYPGAMNKLKSKFENELKEGTFIISNTFAIPHLKPIKTMILDDIYQTKIYLYKQKSNFLRGEKHDNQ